MLDSCVTKIYTEQSIHFVVDSLLNGRLVDGEFDIENKMLLEWIEENIQYRNLGISFLQDYQNLCNAARLMRQSSNMTHMLLVDNTQLRVGFMLMNGSKPWVLRTKKKSRVYGSRRDVIKSLADKLPTHTHARFESDILPILQRLAKDEKWLKEIYLQYLYDNDNYNNPKIEVVDMIALLLNVSKEDIGVRGFFDIVKDKKVVKEQVQEPQQNNITMKPMTNIMML